ncbi:MAG: AAA family ATPase, partial [Nitrospinota bacterium]
MKILALEVAGVRVYRDVRRIEFSPGLNVFVGPNRAGKTSLADALTAALYGAERARSSPLSKSDLQSWALGDGPGDGEFRTAVELESRGGRFRLERDLNAGKARLLAFEDGEWRLRTADARAVATAVKEITGIDRGDLFLATAYLRQGDLARISEEKNLKRMGEILRGIVSGVPEADLSAILAELRKGQRDVKPDTGKGHRPVNPREYDRLLEEREAVRRRIAESEESCRVVLSLAERKAALEEELPVRERRLEQVRALLARVERKARLEKEVADAETEADSLGRRLRRFREIREELRRVREGLEEIGDAEGLIQAVSERLPALRAERDAAEKRLAGLRRERDRLRDEWETRRGRAARLEAFGVNARVIEERLPAWEAAAGLRGEAPPVAPGPPAPPVPSWGKIALAFALFFLVVGAPFLYSAVTGALPPYLFALFGLGFPLLLWAMVLLNRRLLRHFRLGAARPPAEETAPATPAAGTEEEKD